MVYDQHRRGALCAPAGGHRPPLHILSEAIRQIQVYLTGADAPKAPLVRGKRSAVGGSE